MQPNICLEVVHLENAALSTASNFQSAHLVGAVILRIARALAFSCQNNDAVNGVAMCCSCSTSESLGRRWSKVQHPDIPLLFLLIFQGDRKLICNQCPTSEAISFGRGTPTAREICAAASFFNWSRAEGGRSTPISHRGLW